jgi:hypothetical protein
MCSSTLLLPLYFLQMFSSPPRYRMPSICYDQGPSSTPTHRTRVTASRDIIMILYRRVSQQQRANCRQVSSSQRRTQPSHASGWVPTYVGQSAHLSLCGRCQTEHSHTHAQTSHVLTFKQADNCETGHWGDLDLDGNTILT